MACRKRGRLGLDPVDMEMPDMEPEGNVKIPGVDMERQEAPPQFVVINDPDIPQDPSITAREVPDEPDGPTHVSAPATEGPRRPIRVISQPDAYAPRMTGKMYVHAMTKIDSQGVLHSDAHTFAREYFYHEKPEVVIAIMTQWSLKEGLK